MNGVWMNLRYLGALLKIHSYGSLANYLNYGCDWHTHGANATSYILKRVWQGAKKIKYGKVFST